MQQLVAPPNSLSPHMHAFSQRRRAVVSFLRTMATAGEKHLVRKRIKEALRSMTEEQMRLESG